MFIKGQHFIWDYFTVRKLLQIKCCPFMKIHFGFDDRIRKRAGTSIVSALALPLFAWFSAFTVQSSEPQVVATPAQILSLTSVRLLEGPFADAVKANRTYLLALEPDRLLAPYLREAGLEPKAKPYGNWESSGLAGHTGGHYLSALSTMIASGADTPDGELRRRLNYMISELERCQKASGDGYVGGVPGRSEERRVGK